jgi:hypothetical protein
MVNWVPFPDYVLNFGQFSLPVYYTKCWSGRQKELIISKHRNGPTGKIGVYHTITKQPWMLTTVKSFTVQNWDFV